MAFKRINTPKVLKIVVLCDMIYWPIIGILTIINYYNLTTDPNSSNDLEAKKEAGELQNLEIALEERLANLDITTSWGLVTTSILCLVQILLYFGVSRKNRCLLFSWIIISVLLGIIRIYITFTYGEHFVLKLSTTTWAARLVAFFLAAQFILTITNERLGAEEVLPPHFRPQTDDPREFREGLNYPSYPRSLQFADRIVGINRKESANPKKYLPTYDAIDQDGRMVVVVDDPVYEAL